jgi:hypothetical protein
MIYDGLLRPFQIQIFPDSPTSCCAECGVSRPNFDSKPIDVVSFLFLGSLVCRILACFGPSGKFLSETGLVLFERVLISKIT